jgi:hypothetical protein
LVQKNQKIKVMLQPLKVCVSLYQSDSFGVMDALRLISIRTPLQVEVVARAEEAHFLIFAKHDYTDRSIVVEAQRKGIPIIIIGDARLQIFADQIGATYLPTDQYDWVKLYDAIDGALASYPLSYDLPANLQTTLAA